MVVEIWKCLQSTKRVATWICNGTSNMINDCMHSWQIWGWWYNAWCAQAKIWEVLHSSESSLFCYVVGTVYMVTTNIWKTVHMRWELADQPYNRFWNALNGKFKSQGWRMWYIVENYQHCRHYGKKLKQHVPLSYHIPWPWFLMH